jgi:hypothetical protein
MGESIDKLENVFDRYDSMRKQEIHTNVNSGLIKISLVVLVLHFPSVIGVEVIIDCRNVRAYISFVLSSTCLLIHLFICYFICLSIRLFSFTFFLSVYPSIHSPKYRMFHQFFYPPLQPPIQPARPLRASRQKYSKLGLCSTYDYGSLLKVDILTGMTSH